MIPTDSGAMKGNDYPVVIGRSWSNEIFAKSCREIHACQYRIGGWHESIGVNRTDTRPWKCFPDERISYVKSLVVAELSLCPEHKYILTS